MNAIMKNLSDIEIRLLKKCFQQLTFHVDCNLIYERQVPNVAIVLLRGKIELNKRRKNLGEVSPGLLIGVPNLLKNIPFSYNCFIKSDSTILLLPKSELLEVLNNRHSPAYSVLSTLF